MGSNSGKEEKLLFARTHLTHLFSSIIFGEEIETKPLFIANDSLFLNQVARFESEQNPEEVRCLMKQIESSAGRTKEDTARGIIALDIDILMVDDIVLKPEDMKRQYVIDGIKTILTKTRK
ncbi:2-amino-4-hydroxy-6-hydroxymethyldihydropteridine diphosphokinase [Bacteroides sp. 519]|uniref:2-amino-4-hydroxy-6- hydroxymethyldihydropteridine diphosphokinase n=1 Tax=Bacteroides sp. 519 TaxID=2302937 RepID=UPI001EF3742E|nr:2-amino-4-hydroxy-6-hydroxymethyldihydropteridine diphosphokinase [Bacteroides sp. 519]